jgi:hypothetical protein
MESLFIVAFDSRIAIDGSEGFIEKDVVNGAGRAEFAPLALRKHPHRPQEMMLSDAAKDG